MFTALKRIANPKTDISDENRSARPTAMSTNLQKKFSRGVQYNMKIIIKGDKCSGKTSVFRRLQGKTLEDEYKPTKEIQVANVHWNYKNIEDVVKVEVWDVVDRGRKIPVNAGELVNASLDAEFLDVYKGTNGVILVMDVTKNWTFSYVQNEISKVPLNIPVLILGNRCDMGHHHKISPDTVQSFIDSVQRHPDMGQIKYTESSMVNGFGLKYIYKFLALPFLILQRSVLLGQLDRNAEEIEMSLQEIDLFQTSKDADYGQFMDQLNLKRRKKAEDLGACMKSSDSHRPSTLFGLGHPIDRYTSFRKIPQGQLAEDQLKVDVQSSIKKVVSVEEYQPEVDKLYETFFRDAQSNNMADTCTDQLEECSDSESQEDANPLVAKFQEDVDPNDNFYPYIPILTTDAPFSVNEQQTEETDAISFECGPNRLLPEKECANWSDCVAKAMEKRSDSDHKKENQSIDRKTEETPGKTTKKNSKSKKGKYLEGPDVSNRQSKRNKKLKKENCSSRKEIKNRTVSQLETRIVFPSATTEKHSNDIL